MLNHIGGKHDVLQQILEEAIAAGAEAIDQSESGDGPGGRMKVLQESKSGQVQLMEETIDAGAETIDQSQSGAGPSGRMKALQEKLGGEEEHLPPSEEVQYDMESHMEEELVMPEKAAQNKEGVDGGKSVANIQVRLTDGSRLIVTLNHEQTVADLKMYINTVKPEYVGVSYGLMTTFPTKELTEDTTSIVDAGLAGAAVLQRLK